MSRKVLESRLQTSINSQHYYWLDKEDNEINVIDIREGEPVPIEIKYREEPEKIKTVLNFISKFGSESAIVVTKDLFKKDTIKLPDSKEKTILFLPAWLFLLTNNLFFQ